MSRAIVTGGTGVLGRAVVKALTARGYDVIVGSRQPLPDQAYALMDVANISQVTEVIHKLCPTTIIHLAATFENDYTRAFTTNVLGTKNLLSAVQDSGKLIRVVLAGSAAEYGLILPEENPIRECQILRPVSVYGLTKAWQSTYGLMLAYQGLDILVARIFNIDSPDISERLFVGRINRQILEVLAGGRQRIEVGPLSAIRDYVSAEDAANQIIKITEVGRKGEVYHVASGKPISMRELLSRYLSMNGLDFGIVDENINLSNRSGYDVPAIFADLSRTVELLDK